MIDTSSVKCLSEHSRGLKVIIHSLIFAQFIGYSKSRGGESPDCYHTITSAYVDINPPIISVENKQGYRKRPTQEFYPLISIVLDGRKQIFWLSPEIAILNIGMRSMQELFFRLGGLRWDRAYIIYDVGVTPSCLLVDELLQRL